MTEKEDNETEGVGLFQTMFRTPGRGLQLSYLTVAYVFGEMSHYLVGVTSRDMAREIHYGDMACYDNKTFVGEFNSSIVCEDITDSSGCESEPQCHWDYTGLGIQYQALAGPAFTAVFAVSGIVIGLLSDIYSRTVILGTAVIVFSVATALMGAATEYWHLVVLRMMYAAGEAACTPVSVSIIADLYPTSFRSAATGIFNWGIYFGYGFSYLVGVYATEADIAGLSWRFAYIVAGIPPIFVGLALVFVRDEAHELRKERRQSVMLDNIDGEKEVEGRRAAGERRHWIRDSTGHWKEIGRAMIQPTFLLILLSATIRQLAGYSWAYNSRLFYQTYYEDFDVGVWLTWVPIIGGASGVTIGGVASDWIRQKLGVRAQLWLLGGCLILSSPFAVGTLYFPPPQSCIILIFYYLIAETWFGILFIAIVEILPSGVKTSVLGFFLFVMNMVGGNLNVLIDPLSKKIGYTEALFFFWPVLAATSGVLFLVASIPKRRERETDEAIRDNSD